MNLRGRNGLLEEDTREELSALIPKQRQRVDRYHSTTASLSYLEWAVKQIHKVNINCMYPPIRQHQGGRLIACGAFIQDKAAVTHIRNKKVDSLDTNCLFL